MTDRTNRRLLLIFGLSILLSIGAIGIGIMGMIDVLDSDLTARVRDWIEPFISIQADGTATQLDTEVDSGPSAIELEATRKAENSDAILALFADWPIALNETFDENTHNWPVFDENDELASLSVRLQEGKYHWDAVAEDGFVWWSYPDMETLTDFYAEVEVEQRSGDPYGESGLIFRVDEDRFYLYELSGEYYSLWRTTPAGWEELIEWTASNSVQMDGTNTLGVIAIGPEIYLFINNQWVAEVTDDHFSEGVIGLAIGLEQTGDEGYFLFDNLTVRTP